MSLHSLINHARLSEKITQLALAMIAESRLLHVSSRQVGQVGINESFRPTHGSTVSSKRELKTVAPAPYAKGRRGAEGRSTFWLLSWQWPTKEFVPPAIWFDAGD